MSAADLILPGFYGKMPATGDFVTRRLTGEFVRLWDRWLAQHLVPMFDQDTWPPATALRFLAGPNSFGASSAGIILQSADKVGRKFPLSVVAQMPEAPAMLTHAEAWFAGIEEAATAGQHGELTPDELDAALAALPMPSVEPGEELIADMVIWTRHSDIFDIDPQSPQATLETILAGSWETS
ncbi:type VI secretion system-associated protein TagF [Mesorhizobium sp. ArgA1]